MKKMLNMAGIPKIAKVVTKVVEIFHWVGTALMAAATVCALVNPARVKYFVSFEAKECCGAELEIYSFSIRAAVENGKVDMTAFVLFGIGATLILALMAAIFHELSAMISSAGEGTPFSEANAKRLYKVGFYSIFVPVVGMVMSVISRLVLGAEAAEISNGLDGLVVGLVVLCMTQFFCHGIKLENDVEGLV